MLSYFYADIELYFYEIFYCWIILFNENNINTVNHELIKHIRINFHLTKGDWDSDARR